MSERRATADILNDLLDARASGEAQSHAKHDLALAALVDDFFASDDTPGPPPELARLVWRDLAIVAHHDHHHDSRANTNVVVFEPVIEQGEFAARHSAAAQRTRRALSLLATAALVLLALAGSLLALQGTRPVNEKQTESLYLPASNTAIAPVLVMTGVAETWPEANPLLWASLQRITIDPGEAEDANRAVGDATVLFTVESGTLTVDPSGAVMVTRGIGGEGATPLISPAGIAIQLAVNDQIFVPAGVTLTRRNDGAEPVIMLELRIAELEQTHRPENVHYLRLISDKVLNTPPTTPADMTVQRLELLPGESLAIGELPGLQMLVVESGTLELLGGYQLGNQAAGGSDTVEAGNGQAHFDTTTGLANRGTESTVFLAVTITPVP